MKLILRKDWIGPRGVMHAGAYAIPRDISIEHAKCARADGAGEIDRTVEAAPAAAMFPPEIKEQPVKRGPGRPPAS